MKLEIKMHKNTPVIYTVVDKAIIWAILGLKIHPKLDASFLDLSTHIQIYIYMQWQRCHFNPFMPTVPTFAVRETQSLGQQMLNATVGKKGLTYMSVYIFIYICVNMFLNFCWTNRIEANMEYINTDEN